MKEAAVQATTVRDVGLLILTGFALLAGTALMLVGRATAQIAPEIGGLSVAESSITETTATVSWTVTVPSTGQVEFGETPELGTVFRNIIAIEEADVISMSHAIWLFELKPGTTYYYRVRSTSETGGTAVSDIRTFRTLPRAYAGPVLRGVSVTVPDADAAVEGPVRFRAAVDGDASAVAFIVSPVVGGEERTIVGAAEGSGFYGTDAVALDPRAWKVTATASGSDVAGKLVSLQSGTVAFSVSAAIVKDEAASLRPKTVLGMEPGDVAEQEADQVAMRMAVVDEDVDSAMLRSTKDTPVGTVRSSEDDSEGFSVGIHAFGQPAGATPELSGALMEDLSAYALAVGGDAEGAMMGGSMGATDVHDYGSTLCKENFIKPEACLPWLVGEFADGSCREAGILTKGACERFLMSRNGGAFPGCETLSALECDQHKALVTIDLLQDAAFAGADRVIARAGEEKVLVALPGLTSIRPEQIGQARWWKSPRAEGQQTALGMVVFDADLDGLPDDYERSIGTDPLAADSDKDGIEDMMELRNGQDPKGRGPLGRALSPTETTIVFGLPLEQPSARAEIATGFMVGAINATDGKHGAEKTMLSGRCDPGATCVIYLYSYVPTVLTTTADAFGNWQLDLSDTLTDGHHTVYVAVTDDTGRIAKRSGALSLFVNEARAVTFDEFVAENTEPFGGIIAGSPQDAMRKFLYGAVALVFTALLLAVVILRKPKGMTA